MRRRVAWLLFAFVAIACPVFGQRVIVDVGVYIRESNFHVLSASSADYIDIFGNPSSTSLAVSQTVFQDSRYFAGDAPGATRAASAPYIGSVESTSPATIPHCYNASFAAQALLAGSSAVSPSLCMQGPPPPPHGGGGGEMYCLAYDPETNDCMEYADPDPPSGGGNGGWNQDCGWDCQSPIVFNLSDGPYRLTGLNDPVSFDLDANGRKDRVSWTAPGAAMAFLALDRNGNGTIDSGAELFGNHTPLRNAGTASNGFTALADLDDNHDGVIDSRDAIWNRLLLWVDRNHDGISEESELQPLSSAGIVSLGYAYRWTGRTDQYGNTFRYESTYVTRSEGRTIPHVYYDIYFMVQP